MQKWYRCTVAKFKVKMVKIILRIDIQMVMLTAIFMNALRLIIFLTQL